MNIIEMGYMPDEWDDDDNDGWDGDGDDNGGD